MISKEKFCKTLNLLKEKRDKISDINHLLVDEDFMSMSDFGLSSVVTDLLSECMDDKSDWVGYWCWEMDFGQDLSFDSIEDNGMYIDITTPEKLYDFIRKENEDGTK